MTNNKIQANDGRLKEIKARGEKETEKAAADFALTLKGGDVVCLYGALGAGKSVFARALIRALCGDATLDVPSPTFTLVQTYDAPPAEDLAVDGFTIWHFDLYRLNGADEIYELGWEEALLPDAIALVEWPERLRLLLPARVIKIEIRPGEDAESRHIIISRPDDEK